MMIEGERNSALPGAIGGENPKSRGNSETVGEQTRGWIKSVSFVAPFRLFDCRCFLRLFDRMFLPFFIFVSRGKRKEKKKEVLQSVCLHVCVRR
mmetsp:Transcript_30651/g.60324  ORF Transcript_30651/g.60324 Transcript_30651/m.60324 type:complete len:94 (+) Transcript_30651:144-425(+)